MNPSSPAPRRRKLLAGIAVLAVLLCAALAWWHWRSPIQNEEVAAFLNRALGGNRVRFTVDRMVIVRQDDADLQVTVTARAVTLWPLFSKVDAADYLRRTFASRHRVPIPGSHCRPPRPRRMELLRGLRRL